MLVDDSDAEWATRYRAADGLGLDLLAAAEDEVSPADLAIMVHTSGSTADPNGDVHTRGTLVRQSSTLAVMGALHDAVTLLLMARRARHRNCGLAGIHPASS